MTSNKVKQVKTPSKRSYRMNIEDAMKMKALEDHYCLSSGELVRWLIRKQYKELTQDKPLEQ